MIRFLLPSFLLVVGAMLAPAVAVPAHAETQVVSSTVSNEYPSRLVFKLQAGASSNITDVTLSYRLTGRGSSA
ncbi:MAG TPA: hypothetical protein VFY90_06260, partial [Tepidiformaceae bacterium]|nr:hypothetical protein [Tepidiformaceae bacterium]